MTEKKKHETEFTVTDRRRFSEEGASADEAPHPAETEKAQPASAPPGETAAEAGAAAAAPPAPSERAENTRAYQESTAALDSRLRQELGESAAPEVFQAGFNHIVEPLYVTALVQLGFMGQEGQEQRRIDIIGARLSIDALALLQEKTKGNLTAAEATLLEDALYDLRMKYLEVANALARAVQAPSGGPNKA
jgi:hypothetical protein